jgi:hypothetical protein
VTLELDLAAGTLSVRVNDGKLQVMVPSGLKPPLIWCVELTGCDVVHVAARMPGQVEIVEAAQVLDTINDNQHNPSIVECGCQKLSALSTGPARVSIRAESGGLGAIRLILAVMLIHVDDTNVLQNACDALCRLMEQRSDGREIGEEHWPDDELRSQARKVIGDIYDQYRDSLLSDDLCMSSMFRLATGMQRLLYRCTADVVPTGMPSRGGLSPSVPAGTVFRALEVSSAGQGRIIRCHQGWLNEVDAQGTTQVSPATMADLSTR